MTSPPSWRGVRPFPGNRALITERYRYTRNSKGEEQLFDLQADPDEMTDLAREIRPFGIPLLEQLTDALLAADDAGLEHPGARLGPKAQHAHFHAGASRVSPARWPGRERRCGASRRPPARSARVLS